jgi:hypothetical protein
MLGLALHRALVEVQRKAAVQHQLDAPLHGGLIGESAGLEPEPADAAPAPGELRQEVVGAAVLSGIFEGHTVLLGYPGLVPSTQNKVSSGWAGSKVNS